MIEFEKEIIERMLAYREKTASCPAERCNLENTKAYKEHVLEIEQLLLKTIQRFKIIEKNKEEQYKSQTEKSRYQAKNVIIATGFYDIPVYINVPGEDLPKVRHYYKEAHEYAFRKIVVIGANNSSVDAALECWHKGAEVTMVIRKGEINERVKYWIKPDIENRIAEGSIKAYFHSEVKEIKEDEVIINTPQGTVAIKNDFVLALTGYRPDIDFLQRTGITISTGINCTPHYNPETMETNVKGIYLAGVVCGGMETHKWFIENSRIHAEMIISNILKQG
jgi:putative YpdA family bacillithiol system oxidoreductase